MNNRTAAGASSLTGAILPTGSPVLELRSLCKAYGAVKAVSDVSLAVKEGEFLTLLGASGSGKSTILMMIAGFVEPTSGDIQIRGRSIVGIPPHKRRIGIVFQNYALFPHLTVDENIAFSLRNARMNESDIRARVGELLATVRLDNLGERLPAQLSGGQQQRVAIARALAIKPDILLFDEPLGALDKGLREHMVLELQDLHKRLGTTMIYVTHDQQEALIMSDRVAVMDQGRIVAIDEPQSLYDDPGSTFVAEFLGHSNVLTTPAGHLVTVRPEKTILGAVPPDWTKVSGTVVSSTFAGDRFQYELRLDDGQSVQVSVSRGHGIERYEVGSVLPVGWHADDARPVSRSANADQAGLA